MSLIYAVMSDAQYMQAVNFFRRRAATDLRHPAPKATEQAA